MTTSAMPTHNLIVELVDDTQYLEYARLTKQWSEFANDRMQTITDIAVEQLQWLKSSAGICAFTSDELVEIEKNKGNTQSRVYVCKDMESRFQGIMILEEYPTEILLKRLAANPSNQIRGAGTTLVMKAFQDAVLKGKNVSVLPTQSSKSFYQKRGFVNRTISVKQIQEKYPGLF